MNDKNPNLDALLDRFNARSIEETTDEIPEPGTEENPWIGFDRVVNGQTQFYALSGQERRRVRRANERANAAEARRGQRAYNRQQRQVEFDKGTVRMQLGILTGDIAASSAMKANLTAHIERQHRLNERKLGEPLRRENAAKRRSERLQDRRMVRIANGNARHADLVAAGYR